MQALRTSCHRAVAVGRRRFGAPAMGPKPKDGVLFGDSKVRRRSARLSPAVRVVSHLFVCHIARLSPTFPPP